MNEKIAEMEIVGIQPNGQRLTIQIAVGHPYPDPQHDGTWRCPVSLAGLDNRLPDLARVGSFQALRIAINFIRRRLLDTRDTGVRFITVEGGKEFDLPLEAYFPNA
jgi:hypothetical protein